jgi:lysozyme family protein
MADFLIEIPEVLKAEGGYVNNPADKGGETNYGITIKEARERGYNGPMQDLPIELAQQIFKEDYWDALRLDEVNDQQLAGILFNFGVNCGTGTACKALQRALNLLNKNSISWFDTIVDGIMGSKTLGVLNAISQEDLGYARKVVVGLQFERYVKIVEADPTQEVFFRGWVNRVGVLLLELWKVT